MLNLPTTTARTQLPALVNEMSAVEQPADSLLLRAVEIGPRNKGGAVLLPKVDALEAINRIEMLEDELENMAIAVLLKERLANPAPRLIDAKDLIRELGFGDLLDEEDGPGTSART